MANPNDIEAGLPVRSYQDGTDERVLVKIQDGADPGGVDKTAEVSERKVHIRNHSKDSDGNDQEQLLSQEGHSLTNGDYDASLNKRPSSQGLIAHDRKDTAETPAEADQNKRPTAVAYDNGVDETVVCLDMSLHDEDGVPYSVTNPLPVSLEQSEGEEINEHFESATPVTKNNSDDQTYTVTAGKEFQLEQFGVSASGLCKGELFIETGVGTGVFTSKGVLFNSTAMPNAERRLARPIKVAAGVIVKIERTNYDNQAQGLYSFISGLEN